jgi:hypothetical protein
VSACDDLVLHIGELARAEAALTTQLVSVRARLAAAKTALGKLAKSTRVDPTLVSRGRPKKTDHDSSSSSSSSSADSDTEAQVEPQVPTAATAAAATSPEHPALAAAGTAREQPTPAAAGTEPGQPALAAAATAPQQPAPQAQDVDSPPGDDRGQEVLAPPVAAETRAHVSGPASECKKRKYTKRPVCPDDRCRRCWYIECGVPGGPKHTLDGMCMATPLAS